jgi:hypothetical protein
MQTNFYLRQHHVPQVFIRQKSQFRQAKGWRQTQTSSSLGEAHVIGLQAPTCDELISTQRDEILEID